MYEALIQRLYAHCNTDQSDAITNEAAAAIAALQAENAEKDGRIARVEAERDKLLDRAHEAQVERDCARAERDALVKAREEGRAVVLPCKVGDTVYWMWTDSEGNCETPIHADRIYEIRVTKDGVELSIQPYDGSIGKVGIHPPLAVFLTRTEAEAALGGGGDG